MKRDFCFVFCIWGISYIALVWLSTLLPTEYILPAIVSVHFAFWLEGRVFHEGD